MEDVSTRFNRLGCENRLLRRELKNQIDKTVEMEIRAETAERKVDQLMNIIKAEENQLR